MYYHNEKMHIDIQIINAIEIIYLPLSANISSLISQLETNYKHSKCLEKKKKYSLK